VQTEEQVSQLLADMARTISESLGFRTVVVNSYRPAYDDFEVTVVHGSEDALNALLGTTGSWDEWESLLDERFRRHGVYMLPAGEFSWADDRSAFTPDLEISTDPNAWHPDDALFVPLVHTEGHLLGIISVDEPVTGMRPGDEHLQVLWAVAEHAALALQSARESALADAHRQALAHLLTVSSRLTETLATDAVLQSICDGIAALGFQRVSIDLPDPDTNLLVPRHAVGWLMDDPAMSVPFSIEATMRLLEPEFDIAGCYLLTTPQALARVPASHHTYRSASNGRGPRGWDHHWLVVPMWSTDGELLGVIWADDPADRLLPSRPLLQALRVFANQATAALTSARHFEEMRYLAEHDPLTRLPNRLAFSQRLGTETARSGRYHRPFALVLCDLDGFKGLNDRNGHHAGDEALVRLGDLLHAQLRQPDMPFRIGGDEFAMILPETDEAEVRAVVDRIAADLRGEADSDDQLGASFGVAVFPRDGGDPDSLFRAADDAMYAAKRSGAGLHFAA